MWTSARRRNRMQRSEGDKRITLFRTEPTESFANFKPCVVRRPRGAPDLDGLVALASCCRAARPGIARRHQLEWTVSRNHCRQGESRLAIVEAGCSARLTSRGALRVRNPCVRQGFPGADLGGQQVRRLAERLGARTGTAYPRFCEIWTRPSVMGEVVLEFTDRARFCAICSSFGS